MGKGLTLVAKTKKGAIALQRALADNKKASFMQRKAYEAIYDQRIIKDDPLTIRIEHRQKKLEQFIPPSSILPPIAFALKENGAVKDRDYLVLLDE